MTKDEAIERTTALWPGRPLTLRRAAPPRTGPGEPEWFVEVEDDQRLHAMDQNGHVICEHADCTARDRS